MEDTFRITIHMVSSVDGFIAKKDNSVSWFEISDNYEKGVSEHSEKLEIDCYVMGSHTYEHARELSKTYGWIYGDTPTIVLSARKLPAERPNIQFYYGDLPRLISRHLKPKYKNVWVVGGAALVKDFIRAKLAHEIRINILPIILGDGILFFDHLALEQTLHLKNVTAYKNGMVELLYEIKK